MSEGIAELSQDGGKGKSSDKIDTRRAQNRRAQQNYRKSLRQRITTLETINSTLICIGSKCHCRQHNIDWAAVRTLLDHKVSGLAINLAAVLALLQVDHGGEEACEVSKGIATENVIQAMDSHVFAAYQSELSSSGSSSTTSSMLWSLSGGDEDMDVAGLDDLHAISAPETTSPIAITATTAPTDLTYAAVSQWSSGQDHEFSGPFSTSGVDHTPLLEAIYHGQLSIARILLEHGADVNWPNEQGQTALHLCVTSGTTQMAELLLKFGADLSAYNSDGQTPLHVAAASGCTDMVELLIRYGADVNRSSRG